MTEIAPVRPRVTVVIVTWKGLDLTRECLRSLGASSGHDGLEVVVVDNGSRDGTVGALRAEWPGVTVIEAPRNGGFGYGANIGIAASTGDVVVLINNDAVATPGYLDALVAPFECDGSSDLGAVTGRVLLEGRFVEASFGDSGRTFVARDGTSWARADRGRVLVNSTGNEVTRRGNGRDRDWLADAEMCHAPVDVLGFSGGSVALSRKAIEDVGGFDERFFMYYEDTELSWRMRRRGWRIEYAEDAVTRHRHAASSSAGSDFFRSYNERNRIVFCVMHCSFRVMAASVVATVYRAVRGPDRRRRLGVLCEVIRMVPSALVARRRIDHAARVPRTELIRRLVWDGVA